MIGKKASKACSIHDNPKKKNSRKFLKYFLKHYSNFQNIPRRNTQRFVTYSPSLVSPRVQRDSRSAKSEARRMCWLRRRGGVGVTRRQPLAVKMTLTEVGYAPNLYLKRNNSNKNTVHCLAILDGWPWCQQVVFIKKWCLISYINITILT